MITAETNSTVFTDITTQTTYSMVFFISMNITQTVNSVVYFIGIIVTETIKSTVFIGMIITETTNCNLYCYDYHCSNNLRYSYLLL